MPGTGNRGSYQQFNDDDYDNDEGNGQSRDSCDEIDEDTVPVESNGNITRGGDITGNSPPKRFSKTCVKNVFTVLLIFIYLVLTAVAIFLAYQTISDFLNKLSQPVMSVSYKEVDSFPPPGIALFPGNAQLLSCKHHYHDYIPPIEDPGTAQRGDCEMTEVTYLGPFTDLKQKRAVVVRGPSDVKNRELIFMQFSQNETQEDFSAISYMLFAKYSDLIESANKSEFMRDCELKLLHVDLLWRIQDLGQDVFSKTSGRNKEAVEFRQESGVVKFNDKRPEAEQTDQLFFVVFEWRDLYIQEIRLIVTANPWSSVGILCAVFMALFKAANFAKLTITWIIKMRKRHLRHKARELNPVN